MAFPKRFSNLPEYAFPRLRKLLDAHAPGGAAVHMTIGEPRHPMPDFVAPIMAANINDFASYPVNEGTPELLAAIAGWIQRRYGVAVDASRIMALNGTREGLFNAALAVAPEQKNGQTPAVLMPNPFYQVYTVAAVTTGAEPIYVPATAATGHLPDYGALPTAILVCQTQQVLALPNGLTDCCRRIPDRRGGTGHIVGRPAQHGRYCLCLAPRFGELPGMLIGSAG